MQHPKGSYEDFIGLNNGGNEMSKRWKKDTVKCEVCKKEIPRAKALYIKKGGLLVMACPHHIK